MEHWKQESMQRGFASPNRLRERFTRPPRSRSMAFSQTPTQTPTRSLGARLMLLKCRRRVDDGGGQQGGWRVKCQCQQREVERKKRREGLKLRIFLNKVGTKAVFLRVCHKCGADEQRLAVSGSEP